MAKVDKHGRIILYYRHDGTPVYSSASDENKGGFVSNSDHIPGFDEGGHDNQDHDGSGDRARDYHRDNPNPPRHGKTPSPHNGNGGDGGGDNKGGKGIALYRLVHGNDGTLQLAYVDAKTGKIIPANQLSQYNISSVASSLNSVNDIRNGTVTPPSGSDKNPNTKPTTTKTDTTQNDHSDDPFKDHTRSGGMSGGTTGGNTPGSTGTSGHYTNASSAPSTPSKNSEQGDTGDSTDPSANDPNSTGNAHNFADQDHLAGLLGAPNDPTKTGMTAPNYSKDQISDIGKTLAGEIDQSKTDLNTPEGIHEAAAITSTIENRADAQYGGDVSKAVHAPNQYSAWNPEAIDTTNANYNANPGFWDGLAAGIVAHPQLREQYTSYVNPEIAHPSWVSSLTDQTKIGPHLFGVDPTIGGKLKTVQANAVPPTVTVDQSSVTGPLPGPPVEGWTNMAMAGPMGLTTPAPANLGSFPDAVAAQRDFNAPAPNTVNGFAAAYDAQKNNMTDTNTIGPSDRFSNFNPDRFGPATPTNNGMDTGMTAQRDYDPNNPNNFGISVTPADNPTNSFANAYSAQKDYNPNNPNNFGISVSHVDPGPANTVTGPNGLVSGYNAQNSISTSPTDRFAGPVGFDASRFGAPSQPTAASVQNSVGTYGSLTGGFGTHVTTDPNAVANSGAVATHNESQISSPTNNVTSQAPSSQTTDVSSADNSVDAGATPGSTPGSTPGVSADTGGTSAGPGVSSSTGAADVSHDTSGGIASPSAPSTSSISNPTTSTDGVFGGLAGIFGGSTTTATSTTSTDSTADTNSDGSTASTSDGGFGDGYF